MKLPEAFIQQTRALLGNEWDAFEQALQEESQVSIRRNPLKPARLDWSGMTPVPWASDAFYLESRPSFTFDPLFHAGTYYVQEASSMYLEQVIKAHLKDDSKVLDLCAAPGGKSTQLSSLLSESALLVANEVIRPRANILSENLIKWGRANTIVANSDPAAFGSLPGFFDIVVADLPCSGEGMFRKDPGAIGEWSPGNVQLCTQRQRRIVADVWPCLKPGGLFVYSTCTYNKDENEHNLEWIIKECGAELIADPKRFWPHRTKGEGFFIAALRKTDAIEPIPYNNKRQNTKKKSESIKSPAANWLMASDDFTLIEERGNIIAVPTVHYEDYQTLSKKLRLVAAGVALGEMKGKDIIPAHALAMSTVLHKESFPQWEVDKETSLQYLRKEALQHVDQTLPKGFVLITYNNHPLGFVKNIGNRANNLYPSEWRIRSHC